LKEFILGMEQAGAVDPKVLSGRWRDEEITLAEITLATPVGDVVSFAAQIPLKREAIQILAMGPTDAREEALGYRRAAKAHPGFPGWPLARDHREPF